MPAARTKTQMTGEPYRCFRPPQDDDELWWFVASVWGFDIPRKSVCEGHCAPFDAFADAFFARNETAIWIASRGFGGKSTLLALLGLTYAVCHGIEVSIVGGSGQQTERVHTTMKDSWELENAPRDLLNNNPAMMKTNMRNGGRIAALLASEASVRGPHPVKLLCDEVDVMDLGILDSALGQPMSESDDMPSQTIMSSTWHEPDGTMTKLVRRMEQGDLVAKTYEWCYRESMEPHGWLPQTEVDRTRRRIPKHMWETEYDLQRPSEEQLAIDRGKVNQAFREELGEWEGEVGEFIEIEPPDEDGTYATGADWAKESDYTVIVTYRTDVTPWRMVAWQRLQKRPWPEMVAAYDERKLNYGGAGCHDNTGLGDVIDDLIVEHEDVHGIQLVGKARAEVFNEYIKAIENDEIEGPRIKFAWDEHRYCRRADLFGKGHPPDSFVAGALAWHARNFEPEPWETW